MRKGIVSKISFELKNLSFVRPVLEKNRWLTAAYFNWHYRKPDVYNYASCEEESIKRERIAEILKGRSYKRILEVGCGEGYHSGVLAGMGESLLGIDISGKAIKRAAEMHADNPSVSFARADVLTFRPGGVFDLVTCSEVLYYLSPEQGKKAALSLLEILAPGGFFLAVDIFASSESEDGLPLKKRGAGSIHSMLRAIPGLRTVDVRVFPGYEMLLLEKGDPACRV